MVPPPPPPLNSNRGGGGEPSRSIFQIYLEGWILSFSCVFAGWAREYYWCIAVYFKFLASQALHCTLHHAQHLVFRNFSPGCPFEWPLLSMCSSSKPNTPQKSVAQSLSLRRAEHASQQAVSGSFCGTYALVFTRFALCHAPFVFPGGGGGGRYFGYVPLGV